MLTRQRYAGIQSIMGIANQAACLFLCMLSIAEEYLGRDIDFINAYYNCLNNGLIDESFFCIDQEKILQLLTGKRWVKTVAKTLPAKVPADMWTVEKWFNSRTNFTHFKRRGYDTLKASITVKEGKIQEYYCYTVQEK